MAGAPPRSIPGPRQDPVFGMTSAPSRAAWFASLRFGASQEAIMTLIPSYLCDELLSNGRRSAAGERLDPFPVVRLFTPGASAIWLLTELDPTNPDRAFGLCDLGLGCPELGYVLLSELEALQAATGIAVKRDTDYRANRPLSAICAAARHGGAVSD